MNELENLAFKFHFNINIYNKHLLPNIAWSKLEPIYQVHMIRKPKDLFPYNSRCMIRYKYTSSQEA